MRTRRSRVRITVPSVQDDEVTHIYRVGNASDRTTLAPFHSPTITSFLTNLARAIARFN